MKIKLDPMAWIPERAHDTDAGLDLKSPINITVPARGSATIDTGVHIQLPPGTAGMIKSKSGLNVRHGITSGGEYLMDIEKLIERLRNNNIENNCHDCALGYYAFDAATALSTLHAENEQLRSDLRRLQTERDTLLAANQHLLAERDANQMDKEADHG